MLGKRDSTTIGRQLNREWTSYWYTEHTVATEFGTILYVLVGRTWLHDKSKTHILAFISSNGMEKVVIDLIENMDDYFLRSPWAKYKSI